MKLICKLLMLFLCLGVVRAGEKLEGEYEVVALLKNGAEVAIPESDRGAPGFAIRGEQIRGFAGVNRFFGKWKQAEGRKIEKGNGFGSTKMMGPPEAMKFETGFLTALRAVRSWREGAAGVVELLDEAGKVVLKVKRLETKESKEKP